MKQFDNRPVLAAQREKETRREQEQRFRFALANELAPVVEAALSEYRGRARRKLILRVTRPGAWALSVQSYGAGWLDALLGRLACSYEIHDVLTVVLDRVRDDGFPSRDHYRFTVTRHCDPCQKPEIIQCPLRPESLRETLEILG